MDLIMTGASETEAGDLVKKFHYSGSMPSTIRHAFAWREPGGLFGDTGEPIAAITYSQPVSRNFPNESVELSRLVRSEDANIKLSQFVAWSLRWLKKNTTIPFVLSYADTTQGHHGGIYQALNFSYIGKTNSRHIGFRASDESFVHCRACNHRFDTSSIEKIARIRPDWQPVFGEPKHLYIFPIRQRLKKILTLQEWKSMPYPKPDIDDTPAMP